MSRATEQSDLDYIERHGYHVRRLDSGCGPSPRAWVLTDPDGSTLMVGEHGGISPTRREAVLEAMARIAADARPIDVRCHPECYDSDGHTDGCVYDAAESQIP